MRINFIRKYCSEQSTAAKWQINYLYCGDTAIVYFILMNQIDFSCGLITI